MRDSGKTHRIVRHLRTPLIDVGDGENAPVSHRGIAVKDYQLGWFKPGTIRTICLPPFDKPSAIGLVWHLLADGGKIITERLGDDVRKELRRSACFDVSQEPPYVILRKLSGPPGERPEKIKVPDGRKRVLISRYGAYGDHMMTSGLVQHLHDEGWHITYNCTEKGDAVYRGDPRIDDLMVQEHDIIPPNDELRKYWDALSSDYDRFVNLSEVIEGQMLRMEGRPDFNDSWVKRAAECGGNYFDAHFKRAGIEAEGSLPKIYLSEDEREWAGKEVDAVRKKLGKSHIVLWNIFGSSFHKMYPWMFDVWYLITHNRDDIGVLALSDGLGKFVVGNDCKCVFNAGDRYKIRQAMALHSAVDSVVAPETWSLIAGLSFPAPVIALLSHSSVGNYTWREQDVPLHAGVADCGCWPCHQIHYSRNSCPRGLREKSATLCMDQIPPLDVYNALMRIRNEHNALIA